QDHRAHEGEEVTAAACRSTVPCGSQNNRRWDRAENPGRTSAFHWQGGNPVGATAHWPGAIGVHKRRQGSTRPRGPQNSDSGALLLPERSLAGECSLAVRVPRPHLLEICLLWLVALPRPTSN